MSRLSRVLQGWGCSETAQQPAAAEGTQHNRRASTAGSQAQVPTWGCRCRWGSHLRGREGGQSNPGCHAPVSVTGVHAWRAAADSWTLLHTLQGWYCPGRGRVHSPLPSWRTALCCALMSLVTHKSCHRRSPPRSCMAHRRGGAVGGRGSEAAGVFTSPQALCW